MSLKNLFSSSDQMQIIVPKRDDETANPHPDDQRADEHFQRRLVAVDFAEAGKNQIDIFVQTALMHGAAHRGLLGGKKLKRRVQNALIVAVVKHSEGAFDAEMGRLLGAF